MFSFNSSFCVPEIHQHSIILAENVETSLFFHFTNHKAETSHTNHKVENHKVENHKEIDPLEKVRQLSVSLKRKKLPPEHNLTH